MKPYIKIHKRIFWSWLVTYYCRYHGMKFDIVCIHYDFEKESTLSKGGVVLATMYCGLCPATQATSNQIIRSLELLQVWTWLRIYVHSYFSNLYSILDNVRAIFEHHVKCHRLTVGFTVLKNYGLIKYLLIVPTRTSTLAQKASSSCKTWLHPPKVKNRQLCPTLCNENSPIKCATFLIYWLNVRYTIRTLYAITERYHSNRLLNGGYNLIEWGFYSLNIIIPGHCLAAWP